MEAIALVLSFVALIVAALSFAGQAARRAPVSLLIVGRGGSPIEGFGKIIFKRVGQVDDKGVLHFSTDGDSRTWPTEEFLPYKGCLVWVLAALRDETTGGL